MDSHCQCEKCNSDIVGHRFENSSTIGQSEDDKRQRNIPHSEAVRDCKNNPDKQRDPFRFFVKNQGTLGDTEKPHGFLYLALSDPSSANITSKYITHQSSFGSKGFLQEQGDKNLDFIFVFLHEYLVKKERCKLDKSSLTLNAADLTNRSIDDQRTLLRCLYALGNGVPLTCSLRERVREETKGFEKPRFMGSYAATDILFRLQQRNPCPLQSCLSETIHAMTGSTMLIELLSFFRICTSIKPITSSINATWNCLSPLKLHPKDYHVASLDNLGFHDKKNVECDQWVAFLFQIVKETQLKRLGFYNDNPAERISRTRKSVKDFIRDAGGHGATARVTRAAESLVQLTNNDYSKEGFCNLQCLNYCIAAKLPSCEECIDRIKDQQFDTGYKLARNFGIDVSEKQRCCMKDGTVVRHDPKIYDGADGAPQPAARPSKSILDANNYVLDTPAHDDLCKLSTVETLMDYVTRTCNKVVKDGNQNQVAGEEQPVQEINYPFTADGSPIRAAIGIKEKDTQEGKYKDLVPFFGGFHFMLQQVTMAAELSYEFRHFVIKGWRPTQKRQEWVLSPSDPKQFELEVISQMAAMWRAAVDSYAEHHSKTEVSAAEVHHFMLERAATYPFAHAQLIEYRWLMVYFMIRDSEVSWSIDQFFTTVRLALRLCTISNATNCTLMLTKLLLWWETASPADKILYENFVFASKSAAGKNCFKDRAQEKVQLMCRGHLGGLKRPSLAKKMHYVTENLGDMVSKKKALEEIRGEVALVPSFNQSVVEVGEVYIKTYVAYRDMYCWEPAQAPLIGSRKHPRNASTELLQSPVGERLPADILQSWRIGQARAIQHSFNLLRVEARLQNRVEEADVSIKRLGTRSASLLEHCRRRKILRTSVLEADIKKINRLKDPLIDEILYMKNHHPDADFIADVAGNVTNDNRHNLKTRHTTAQLLEILLLVRKNYYEIVPDGKKQLLNTLRDEHKDECKTTKAERELELLDPHYSFLHLQVAMFVAPVKIGSKRQR